MEASQGKSVHGDHAATKDMKAASSDEQSCQEKNLFKEGNMTKVETSSAQLELKRSSPAPKQQEDPLASAKEEMSEMVQENQRLRMHLDRVMKDYQTLEMKFQDIVHQEATKSASTINNPEQDAEEPDDFVSLSLGRTSNDAKKDETSKIHAEEEEVDVGDKSGLALGLDCNYHEMPKKDAVELSSTMRPENSVEGVKEEAGEASPPQKMLKRSNGDDEILQQNPTKRARVSVRVRCDTPTMNDGCQWRKYGQKVAKGNPCPRAYYRCTVAPNCPVRKQVQRCAEDMSILTTTYEGTHNHPLPVAATAIASTTSAAASMLLSGSSSSSSGPTNINGLKFSLSDNSYSKPFYTQNSSSSISSSPAFPTVTLDLTSSSFSSLSTLNRIGNIHPPPKYSSTNLNFGSFDSNSLPISWSNGIFNNGAPSYNKNQVNSTRDPNGYFALSFEKQPQENLYQSFLQKNFLNSAQMPPLPPDTIAAATKAITSDPSFQSALVSALSSIIGTANGKNAESTLGNQVLVDDKPGQILKLGEPFPVLSSFPSTSNAIKCASSFLNTRPSSTNSQQVSFFPLQPSFPFPSSKSKSTSPREN